MRSARPRQSGFTLIETLIALTLIMFAIIVTVQTLDSSRNLTDIQEKKAVAAKVGEQEVERLLALPYPDLALSTNPAQDNTKVPLSYILPAGGGACTAAPFGGWNEWSNCCPSGGSNCYKWYQKPALQPYDEQIVVANPADPNAKTGGAGTAGPTAWSDQHLRGQMYRIITWVDDPGDNTTVHDYKRITVAVTVDAGKQSTEGAPVLVTSMSTSPSS